MVYFKTKIKVGKKENTYVCYAKGFTWQTVKIYYESKLAKDCKILEMKIITKKQANKLAKKKVGQKYIEPIKYITGWQYK